MVQINNASMLTPVVVDGLTTGMIAFILLVITACMIYLAACSFSKNLQQIK